MSGLKEENTGVGMRWYLSTIEISTALDKDLKCSIIDRIVSEGGDQCTGCILRSFTQFANEMLDRKHRKICMVQILGQNANMSEA